MPAYCPILKVSFLAEDKQSVGYVEGGAVKQDSLRLELEKANESIKMLRLENDRKSKELEDVKQNVTPIPCAVFLTSVS